MLLKNALFYNDNFDLENGNILIKDDIILKISPSTNNFNDNHNLNLNEIDLTNLTLLPGFIDIHIHGCNGEDFVQFGNNTYQTAASYLANNGITSFCPTFASYPTSKIKEAINYYKDIVSNKLGNKSCAYIQGLNFEGRYLSPNKKGAQSEEYLVLPSLEDFKQLQSLSNNLIKLCTVAPELENAGKFIKEISHDCNISLGHTNCDYNEAVTAFDNGANHITHLFNAMNPLHHRNPGLVGVALELAKEKNIFVELICDLFHIHKSVLKLCFKAIGEDNTVIVSDAMSATGCKDGKYIAGGGDIVEVVNGKSVLEDGTISASTTNIYEAAKKMINLGIDKKQVIKSLTINPAKSIGVDHLTGSIRPEKYADLVAVDSDFNIKLVIIKGTVVLNKV